MFALSLSLMFLHWKDRLFSNSPPHYSVLFLLLNTQALCLQQQPMRTITR